MHPVREYKYFYVYKITNIVNSKIYIGIHATNNLENNYMGSGVNLKKAIKKYGRDKFIKEILGVFETYHEVLLEERRLVTTDFVKDTNTYNLEIGGNGGKVWFEDQRKKMSNTKKELYQNGLDPWNKGKKVGNFMTDSAKTELSKRMSGSNNHMYGIDVNKMLSPEKNTERLRKISENNQKPKKTKEKYSHYAKQRFWIVNNQNKLEHCLSKDDPRLVSGQYQIGRKWKIS